MSNIENDKGDMYASITEDVFKAASEGNVENVFKGFKLLPTLSRDCKDKRGWTPLMLAARNGHVNVIEAMLQDGADVKMFNNSGQNALDIASFWNQGPALRALKGFLKAPKSPELEFVNYFSQSVVDRQSYKRQDVHHIKMAMESEKAKFVIFGELDLLITPSSSPASPSQVLYFSWKEIKDVLKVVPEEERSIVFLGVGDIENGILYRETMGTINDTYVYFGVNFKQKPTEDQLPVQQKGGEYVGRGYRSRRGITALRNKESGLIAQARSVLAWHEKNRFCPACGSKTVSKDSGHKRVCTAESCVTQHGAHNTSFPRTDPVVIVLVVSVDGTKCLLGRQSRFPPGVYSCCAGFMEPGETIEDAARREVFEEAGVKVGKLSYHSSQPWPFPASLMIGLIGDATSDVITVDQVELEDAKWFTRSEVVRALTEGFQSEGLKIPPSSAIAHQLMKAWVKMSSNL